MSLPEFNPQSALFASASLSPDFFGPTDRYRLFAEKIYPLLVRARDSLTQAYCSNNGRAAVEPVLLLGVSLLQFLEGAPDRQALDLLRYHAGWNFALNRTVGDKLFHPTVLTGFRNRLIEHEQSRVIFQSLLEGLIEAGLVERQSRQRLDSTHVLGVVARMSRLECMRETLRLALQELEEKAVLFAQPAGWEVLCERYVTTKLDYRTAGAVLHQKMDQAGTDALQLLDWVRSLSDTSIVQGPQMLLLARVLEEQFEVVAGVAPTPRQAQPTGAVHNPHESQAQWSAKGQGKARKEWVGYKTQVAETVHVEALAKNEPTRSFLTAVETQAAPASDEAGAEQVQAAQAQGGLEPASELYVDGAYVSGGKLAEAAAQGREIVGPAQRGIHKEGRYGPEDFDVCVEEQKAVCPAGKQNTQCSRLEEEKTGRVNYRFEWSTHCRECPLREQCVGEGQKHRTLLVGEHHTHLQQRRQEQQTEAFQTKCQRRNAIEGTHSELVRAHGLRQARYRGLKKVRLQNYFIGAACNAKRWIRRVVWEIKTGRATLEPALETG